MKLRPIRRQPISEDSNGFTLIEVLIAIAVFSIGLLAVGTLILSSVNGNATARRVTEASTWASDRIEKLMAISYEDLESSATPVVEGGYSISWMVTPDAPLPNVKTVQVTVASERKRPGDITFEYYKVKKY